MGLVGQEPNISHFLFFNFLTSSGSSLERISLLFTNGVSPPHLPSGSFQQKKNTWKRKQLRYGHIIFYKAPYWLLSRFIFINKRALVSVLKAPLANYWLSGQNKKKFNFYDKSAIFGPATIFWTRDNFPDPRLFTRDPRQFTRDPRDTRTSAWLSNL